MSNNNQKVTFTGDEQEIFQTLQAVTSLDKSKLEERPYKSSLQIYQLILGHVQEIQKASKKVSDLKDNPEKVLKKKQNWE